MQVMADTDADLFAFETIPSVLEAQALLELLKEFPGKTAWLSFSCRDEKHVSHGELFSECAALADREDVRLPHCERDEQPAWSQLTLRSPRAATIRRALDAAG